MQQRRFKRSLLIFGFFSVIVIITNFEKYFCKIFLKKLYEYVVKTTAKEGDFCGRRWTAQLLFIKI